MFPVEPRNVDFDGLRFVEVMSATRIEGGIASNVIPERAACLVNYRYAPDRSPEDAAARIRELAETAGADELAITGNSSAAPVVADAPLVRRLQAAGDLEARAEAGLDAGGRVRSRGRRRDQLRPGRDRASPTAETSRSRSPPWCAPTKSCTPS